MNANRPDQRHAQDDLSARRTVIPTPRSNPMFAGWGVRL